MNIYPASHFCSVFSHSHVDYLSLTSFSLTQMHTHSVLYSFIPFICRIPVSYLKSRGDKPLCCRISMESCDLTWLDLMVTTLVFCQHVALLGFLLSVLVRSSDSRFAAALSLKDACVWFVWFNTM